MMGTKDHPPYHQRDYHPARQLRLGIAKIIRRNRKKIGNRKKETFMQDLKEVNSQLEGCACSYGTSSMSLTSKTYHTHTPNHTNIDLSSGNGR